MRVYELAAKIGTTSLAVMRLAEANDVEVYSPLSSLESDEVETLNKAFLAKGIEQVKAEAIKMLADTFSISTAQATQLADAGFLSVDGILETDEADFAAATGLDDVTATGIYAAAKAVAELIGEEEEEE